MANIDGIVQAPDISCNTLIIDRETHFQPVMMQTVILEGGYTGQTNYVWCIGPTGPTGPMGDINLIRDMVRDMSGTDLIGPTGPMGPMGSIKDMCKTFLNAYSITEQTIDYGKPIFFDTHTAIMGGCFHEPQSSDIWICKAGFYNISINVSAIESAQFSLVKNESIIVPGTTMGSFTGLSINNITTIIYISEDDMTMETQYSQNGLACKLQVINNTRYIPSITLYGSASTNNIIQQNTATITILHIA